MQIFGYAVREIDVGRVEERNIERPVEKRSEQLNRLFLCSLDADDENFD